MKDAIETLQFIAEYCEGEAEWYGEHITDSKGKGMSRAYANVAKLCRNLEKVHIEAIEGILTSETV